MAEWCEKNGLLHFTYVKKNSFSPFVAAQIKEFCRDKGVEIMHLHDSHAHTFGVISRLLGCRIPMVLSRRVDFKPGKGFFSRFKYAHRGIRRILCVSDAISGVMREYMPGDSRIFTVYSGIDLSKYDGPATGSFRKELGLPDDSILVINVAALAAHKDPQTFARVASVTLKKDYPKLYFVWVGGDDGEKQNMERLIAELQLQDRVLLTGFRRDIPDLLKQANAFLFTSLDEGLGTSVLDAMACGLPIVTTTAGGIPEMVIDGVSGLLAPPGDVELLSAGLSRVLDDPGLASHLSLGAKKRVGHFTVEKTAEATLRHYREILAESDKTRA